MCVRAEIKQSRISGKFMEVHMKRIAALLLALTMCVCLFAACGGAPANNGGANNGGVVDGGNEVSLAGTYNIKVWVAEAAVDLTTSQIKKFNETNTDGIVINATIEPVGEGEAATSMTTDVEAGADIFCFAQDQTARLIQAGALSKLGTSAGKLVSEANDPGVVSAAKSGEDLWAYPLTSDNGYFLYYDKSVVKEESIDSLEAIIADCEAAGKMFSFELEGSAWYTASFFFATGCYSNWTTDSEGKFTGISDNFNSDKGVIASKGMLKLLSSSCYNNASKTSGFEAGVPSAAVVSGTWDFETAKSILGDNLGVTDLPSFEVDGTSYHLGSFNGCKLMGVKPQTDAVRAAVLHKLAQYLTSEECQRERFNTLSWGPANLVAQQDEAVQANPGLKALLAQAPYSVPQGQIHGSWWDIAKVVATNVKEGGEAGIQGALDTYKASIDALFGMSEEEMNAWAVIGAIGGTNWDTDLAMTELEDGTWKSNEAYELTAETQFKVRQGKSWDNNYGANGEFNSATNISLETLGAEAGTYYIVFDPATGIVTLSAE